MVAEGDSGIHHSTGWLRRDRGARFPKPIIAAVTHRGGRGFEIALACDLIVAADTSWFGLFEVKRGLFAGGGGLIRLPRRSPALAMEIAIVGSTIDAARVFGRTGEPCGSRADVVSRAVGLAEEIAALPLVVRQTRQMVRERAISPRNKRGNAAQNCREVYQSPDPVEGARLSL
jgi:enoyl-CoA hydratase